MTTARYSIGIDLGTTNSAMAFVPLDGTAATEVFKVPQWGSVGALSEATTLPSFLFRPDPAEAADMEAAATGKFGTWIVGQMARKRTADMPARVAHSAKSWLCHHTADQHAPFLPWGSDVVAAQEKISPVDASALILNYLRGAWNNRFASSGADFTFDAQMVTVTVPASFDAAGQRLTLEAAAQAGYPSSVRLLEEPQAAFYRWLEQHDAGADLWQRFQGADSASHHVLVVDIGGGTSDFSLFELRPSGGGGPPVVHRVAVSDHLLLGGDNIDLALAHVLEPRLGGAGLVSEQWEALVARCRDLKENVLSREGAPDETLTVSIAGRGSSLMAGARSATITRAEMEALLFDGFFPECKASAAPQRRQTALKEWGLPFARDSAVTRHLAEFVRDRPTVDAVLFNGGALYPKALRQRIARLLGAWRGGAEPLVLENDDPDLAVAQGAARYGKILYLKAERIEAGAGRAVFLAVHRNAARREERDDETGPTLVCVLPRGAPPEAIFETTDLDLSLRLNRPVRFEPYSSTRHGDVNAGDVVPYREDDFAALPPLETVARTDDENAGHRAVAVALQAQLNELGLLQVACVSRDPQVEQTWPLEFNLRTGEHSGTDGAGAAVEIPPNASPQALKAAQQSIATQFTQQPGKKKDKLTAARLLKNLEAVLELPKAQWNWVLVRALWPSLEACMAHRARSADHEEAWIILAGFVLRPGWGAPLDDTRMNGLWRFRRAGLAFPSKRTQVQEFVLWRRVAGGLSREQQERIITPELPRLMEHTTVPDELVRLAGSLERLGVEVRTQLAERFIDVAAGLANDSKHCAPYLAALTMLLNRAPLHAGPESVMSPDLVERTFTTFEKFDWTHAELRDLQTLFLRAARVVDNRSLDLPRELREKIARKLEKSGLTPQRTVKLHQYMPLERAERTGLYGEALPPGLLLGE
jgi:molecular chaperone DnaK (HSP70)